MIHTIIILLLIVPTTILAESLPPQVSFSAKATARILRGDINLKGYDFYLVAVTRDEEKLKRFSTMSKEGMLRIHAKDIESEGIDSLLLIDDYDKDYVRIVNPNTDPPEIYETAFDRMVKDLNEYLEGKLKPIVRKTKIRKYGDSVKSVPCDEENAIEAAEFRGKILEPSSIDSVLLVHDPSCDVCVRLRENEWKRLIEMHQHVKSLEFHQIDGTQNEIQGLSISSYPTIFLFRAFDKNEPLVYKGERTSTVISTWLQEKVGMRFTMPSSSSSSDKEL